MSTFRRPFSHLKHSPSPNLYIKHGPHTKIKHPDGWTTEDLVFQWKQTDPVQVARNMHLPRFILEKFQTDLCNSITNTGKLTFFYWKVSKSEEEDQLVAWIRSLDRSLCNLIQPEIKLDWERAPTRFPTDYLISRGARCKQALNTFVYLVLNRIRYSESIKFSYSHPILNLRWDQIERIFLDKRIDSI